MQMQSSDCRWLSGFEQGLFTSPCLSLIRIYPRPGPFSRILKPRAESLFVFLPWLEGYQLTGIYLQLLTRPPEAESKSQI